MYTPDKWVVIKITTPDETLYKVAASFYGGYAYGDSWKINSGIVSVTEIKDYYYFLGYSGSVYRCYKHNYGVSLLMHSVLCQEQNNLLPDEFLEILPENVDFGCIEYSAVVE